MLLPLGVQYKSASNGGKGYLELVLGAKRLSSATLLSGLEGIVTAGDAPFIFELRCTPPLSILTPAFSALPCLSRDPTAAVS